LTSVIRSISASPITSVAIGKCPTACRYRINGYPAMSDGRFTLDNGNSMKREARQPCANSDISQ
jgi:hypothetical protein